MDIETSKACMSRLVVNPDGHLLMDDKLEIKIVGLKKRQEVTKHAVIKEGENVFESCCCFISDDDGEVNLATQPSIAGSYTGVSPMGIFWSMVQAPGQKDGLRLIKKDVTTPLRTRITVYNGHLSVTTIHSSDLEPLCTDFVDRWYMGKGVKREVVRDGRIRGVLYLPAGDGPFPGAIDMFGGAGGIIEIRAALLASRGFACLSLPIFMYEDLPDNLADLNLDYFLEATDWMCSHKNIFHDGIGVLGVSKGGEIALMMAAHSEKVTCVVNINGTMFVASWGIHFRDSYLPPVLWKWERCHEENGAYVTRDCWDYTKEDLTPVWRNNAKILNILGEDDKNSPWEHILFAKEHIPLEKRDNFQIASYPHAGHLIEPPYTPLCKMSYNNNFKMYFWWGGQPESHAAAQEDSWQRILHHLNQHIPRSSVSDIGCVTTASRL